MTQGQILFYGGIAGSVIFSILLIICLVVGKRKRKNLIKKIEQEILE